MPVISKCDYIVILSDSSYSNNWTHYCFKQSITLTDKIHPETTPKHPVKNVEESFLLNGHNWRYATIEEKVRYNKEGHFDVTTKPKGPKEINYYEIF